MTEGNLRLKMLRDRFSEILTSRKCSPPPKNQSRERTYRNTMDPTKIESSSFWTGGVKQRLRRERNLRRSLFRSEQRHPDHRNYADITTTDAEIPGSREKTSWLSLLFCSVVRKCAELQKRLGVEKSELAQVFCTACEMQSFQDVEKRELPIALLRSAGSRDNSRNTHGRICQGVVAICEETNCMWQLFVRSCEEIARHF